MSTGASTRARKASRAATSAICGKTLRGFRRRVSKGRSPFFSLRTYPPNFQKILLKISLNLKPLSL